MEERGSIELRFDHCFPGAELGFKWTVLLGRERTLGMTVSTVVPMKGSNRKFAIDKVLSFLEECVSGSGDIVLTSDHKPAIEYLLQYIMDARGNETGSRRIVEESVIKSRGTNVRVERSAQTIEGQIRVIKIACEDRLGKKFEAKTNVNIVWQTMRVTWSTIRKLVRMVKRHMKETTFVLNM